MSWNSSSFQRAKVVRVDAVVFCDGSYWKDCFVVYDENRVISFERRIFKPESALKLQGTLFPPFINAHTHLEYSEFEFSPEKFSDFFHWLKEMITFKRQLSDKKQPFKKGLNLLKSAGTIYCGNIASFEFQENNGFPVVLNFLEVIGNVEKLEKRFYSPHAPYSVSPESVLKISRFCEKEGLLFQMHIAESKEERKFLKGEENRFEKEIKKITGRLAKVPKCKDYRDYFVRNELLKENFIAVHCTNLTHDELELLVKHNVGIVMCPRSNVFLKNSFPPVDLILGYEKLAIATDGICSNTDLNLANELKFVYERFKGKVKLNEILPLITCNPAKVLGIDLKEPVFTYTEKTSEYPLELLLSAEFKTLDLRELL